MNRRASQLTLDPGKFAGGSEEEEDEDVPLGILAAHGFPSKTRPPSKLMNSSSNPNLRHLSQIAGGAGSVAGGESQRGSLPAFARHLPADPYYGAGIVNPSVREPLAMHSSTNLSGPQPSGAATAHPVHPAGLVGVIAGIIGLLLALILGAVIGGATGLAILGAGLLMSIVYIVIYAIIGGIGGAIGVAIAER